MLNASKHSAPRMSVMPDGEGHQGSRVYPAWRHPGLPIKKSPPERGFFVGGIQPTFTPYCWHSAYRPPE